MHVEVVVNTAFAGDTDGSGAQIEQAAITLAIHGLGEIDVPAQAVTYNQLWGDTPGVLAIEEPAFLPFSRSGVGADVAGEVGNVAQKESSQGHAAGRIGSIALVKGQLASAVAVTGNAQIQGIADVCTELNGVVADDAGPVVDELILVFALQQRAVATIDAQAKTDAAKGAGTNNIASVFITRVAEAADKVTRLAGSKIGTQVKTGDANITRRCGANAVGDHVDVILHVAEAEIGQQVGA